MHQVGATSSCVFHLKFRFLRCPLTDEWITNNGITAILSYNTLKQPLQVGSLPFVISTAVALPRKLSAPPTFQKVVAFLLTDFQLLFSQTSD